MRWQVDLVLTVEQKPICIAMHVEQKLGDGAACLRQRCWIDLRFYVVGRLCVGFRIVMQRARGIRASWAPGGIMRRLGWRFMVAHRILMKGRRHVPLRGFLFF